MRLKRLYLDNKKIIFLLGLFSLVYAIFLIIFNQLGDVWWDSASYIGMGKYIFSGGETGMFEPMKSVFLPFLLGGFWWLGFDIILSGKLLVFCSSIVSLIFVYLITREFFNERTALLSVVILAFNSLFFIFTFRIYTEIFSVCFILGSLFFSMRYYKTNKISFLILISLFSALAFLSKYQNLIFLLVINLFFVFYIKDEKFKKLILLNLFFFIFLSPFFILNCYYYGNPVYLVNLAQSYFKENIGNLYNLRAYPGIPPTLFKTTDLIYFKTIFYLFNFLIPLFLMGFYKLCFDRNKKKFFLIALPFLLFFAFLEIFYLKQDRYILLAFPFISIISAYGISKIKNKKFLTVLLSLYFVISGVFSGIVLHNSSSERDYTAFFTDSKEIYCESSSTSDPRVVLNPDVQKVIFPYEVFDNNWSLDRRGVMIAKENPNCIFYFSCSEFKDGQIKEIEGLGYRLRVTKDTGRCKYAIFTK